MTDVYFTNTADDDLDRLGHQAREQIVKKIREAKEWPDHFLKPLSGSPYYSLRSGKYRAVIDWDKEDDEMTVLFADKRDKVYDRL